MGIVFPIVLALSAVIVAGAAAGFAGGLFRIGGGVVVTGPGTSCLALGAPDHVRPPATTVLFAKF